MLDQVCENSLFSVANKESRINKIEVKTGECM